MDILNKLYKGECLKIFFNYFSFDDEKNNISFSPLTKGCDLVVSDDFMIHNGFKIVYSNKTTNKLSSSDLIITSDNKVLKYCTLNKFNGIYLQKELINSNTISKALQYIFKQRLTIKSKSLILVRISDLDNNNMSMAIGLKRNFELLGFSCYVLNKPDWYLKFNNVVFSINLLTDTSLKKTVEPALAWIINPNNRYDKIYLQRFKHIFCASPIYKINNVEMTSLFPPTDVDIHKSVNEVEIVYSSYSSDFINNGFYESIDLDAVAKGHIFIIDEIKCATKVLGGLVLVKNKYSADGFADKVISNNSEINKRLIKNKNLTYKYACDMIIKKFNSS